VAAGEATVTPFRSMVSIRRRNLRVIAQSEGLQGRRLIADEDVIRMLGAERPYINGPTTNRDPSGKRRGNSSGRDLAADRASASCSEASRGLHLRIPGRVKKSGLPMNDEFIIELKSMSTSKPTQPPRNMGFGGVRTRRG